MLFDHCLCIAKPRRTVEAYRLIRKPIRLEMVNTSGWDEAAVSKGTGFHLRNVITNSDRRDGQAGGGAGGDSKMWPIVFRIAGRLGGTLTLFVEASRGDRDGQVRQEWRTHLAEAITRRREALDHNKVFDLRLLMDAETRQSTGTQVHQQASMGRIHTSCPFVGPSGQSLVAVGASSGLYIAVRYSPSSLRQILQIPVGNCAVLQDFGLFLVQTEGRLLSYLLETLVQSSSVESKGQQGPQQVSGQKDILFFRVGKVGLRTLVVYAKRDGVNSTVLKAMEPVAHAERSRVQHSRFLGMGAKKTEWFRLFKVNAVSQASRCTVADELTRDRMELYRQRCTIYRSPGVNLLWSAHQDLRS